VWGIALRMILHEKLKTAGTLFGVVFSALLVNQNGGMLLGLMERMTALIGQSDADIWVAQRFTESVDFSDAIPMRRLFEVQAVPGVAWAEPAFVGHGIIKRPLGDFEPVALIGSNAPRFAIGPRSLRDGTRIESLTERGAIFVEWTERKRFGQIEIGDVREVSGVRSRLAGYTERLTPFGQTYVFANLRQAQQFAHVPEDTITFVLVKVAPGHDVEAVRRQIADKVQNVEVFSRDGFRKSSIVYWFRRTPIGVNFGMMTGVAILVGFVIVSLTMLTAVVDRVRDFGTLRAIGARRIHLFRLMLAQAGLFAVAGYGIGVGFFHVLKHFAVKGGAIIINPPWLYATAFAFVLLICIGSSLIAIRRVLKVEPGLVFRS